MIIPPITYVYGLPGCGKTYFRCARFYYDYLLPETSARIITNFPVDVDTISLKVAEKTGKNPDEYASRFTLIPHTTLQNWMMEKGNPIEYFDTLGDLRGAHITLDEIHNFCGSHHSKKWRSVWEAFLGEVRHRQATFEAITQADSKVADSIKKHAQLKFIITNTETLRDPFFGIQYYQWHQLTAKWVGDYQPKVTVRELRYNGEKWEDISLERHHFEKFYYQFYNSYSAPFSGGAGANNFEHPYQKSSWPQLVVWFWRAVKWRLLTRVAIVCLALWICFFGGISYGIDIFMKILYGSMGSQMPRKEAARVTTQPAKILDKRPDYKSGFHTFNPNRGNIKNISPSTIPADGSGQAQIDGEGEPYTSAGNMPATNPALYTPSGWSLSKDALIKGSREYRKGDKIAFHGKELVIVLLDWRERKVTLENGTTLYIGDNND